MKKHEYRAYDKVEETMWKDVLGDMGENDNYDEELSMWSVANAMEEGDDSRFVFMEYINQKDVEEKKVFVDDIVETVDGVKAVVRYDDEKMMYVVQGEVSKAPYYQYKDKVKVIGNIHQNPELL